jgi:hypothetical protein
MKKIFKLEFLGSIASVIALGFFIYYQFFYEADAVLEIKIINREELTKIPTDNNLKVEYSLKGRDVTNLYKIRFSIKNMGNKTIIGKDNIGLVTEPLPLNLDENSEVYGIQITDSNFPIELVKLDSFSRAFSFKQWRSGEFIEISAYVGNDDYSNIGGFSIDERDIIDGQVIFTEFKNEETTFNPRLIDRLPLSQKNTAWWILIVSYIIGYISSIWQFFVQIKSEDIRDSKAATVAFIVMWLILNIIMLTPLLWVIET